MNEVAQQQGQTRSIKDYLNSPAIMKRFEEMLGKRASAFTTSVLQIVNSNSMLVNAEPQSVMNAAMMAATLNLPLNNNLGFAYIVPYSTHRKDNNGNRIPVLDSNGNQVKKQTKNGTYPVYEQTVEAQFQLGYKGFIQLAQRSGQFKRIAAAPVRRGQLISADPLRGYEFDWTRDQNAPVIGYVAFFELVNGFESYLYMTNEEINAHAGKFSQTYKSAEDSPEEWKKAKSVWHTQREAMALKTVLKLLLSKYAPLSIDMQMTTAIAADQAVMRDVNGETVFEYPDNQPTPVQAHARLDVSNDAEAFAKIGGMVASGELTLEHAQERYVFSDEQVVQMQMFGE